MIKVDLEKAYDRISWKFLEETLDLIGIPVNLKNVIMDCVTLATMQVLWNEEPTTEFKIRRGVRQGCPLSPYLFVLCLDRLFNCIIDSVQEGKWKPMRVGRHGSLISHLMFAYDILLFAEASVDQIREISTVLKRFCDAGQTVNRAKTIIYFSKDVKPEDQNQVTNIGGFKVTSNVGKYLRLPIVHGRIRIASFHNIVIESA